MRHQDIKSPLALLYKLTGFSFLSPYLLFLERCEGSSTGLTFFEKQSSPF